MINRNNNLNLLSDKWLLERIGRFVHSDRLNQHGSQVEVSDKAGLSTSLLSLFERIIIVSNIKAVDQACLLWMKTSQFVQRYKKLLMNMI